MMEAFHLPGLPDVPTTEQRYGSGDAGTALHLPVLTPALLERQVDALIAARRIHLADRPIRRIIEIIDHIASRFQDGQDPLRVTAESLLPAVTGYSLPMVRAILDGMAADWRTSPLEKLLASEFADPRVLDGFIASPTSGRTHVIAPDLITHIFSGNVPGVAVTSLVRALLVKSASLGKTAEREPILPVLFARGISEADAGLGECLAIAYWPGGDVPLESVAFARAGAVVAYGGNDAVESIRRRTPARARFIGYGNKLSLAVLGRSALTSGRAPEVARLVARDVALFDQHGCVSPHVVYAEDDGEISPMEWTEMLAAAMAELEAELPRGALGAGEATAIRQLRAEAEFAQLAGSGLILHTSDDGTAWTVLYDPDPTFSASCLNRVVRVKAVSDLDRVITHLEPLGGLLQTMGMEVDDARRDSLAKRFAELGVSRICQPGTMAWPPPSWHHDGRPPLRDLVRWCDIED